VSTPLDAQLSIARRARVLYVDDDPLMVEAFRHLLSSVGIHAEGCLSAAQALRLARSNDYTIFALDLCMPEMDGNELANQLGHLRPRSSYILVTGKRDLDLPDRNVGVQSIASVVHKPWDLPMLIATLARAQTVFEERTSGGTLKPVAPDQRPLPILLVEDNPADAALVRALLRRTDLVGLEVVHARRLSEALSWANKKAFGAVVADLSLPDARGLDAVLKLRDAYPATPVVVLSGVNDDALSVRAVQEGAQEYLLKSELTTSGLQRAIRRAAGRKAAAEELSQLIERDPVTGLYTRLRFEEKLRAALTRADHAHHGVCMLYIDLDRFKQINDRLGHAAGDEVLREAASRVRHALREHDLVARLGGDELAAVVENVHFEEEGERFAQRILSAIEKPFDLGEHQVSIGASIGLAFYPDDARNASELTVRADQAMYRVKRRGRGGFAFSRDQTGEIDLVSEGVDPYFVHTVKEDGIDVQPAQLIDLVTGKHAPMQEAEPAWRTDGLALDPETIRRLAASADVTRELHQDLLSRSAKLAQRLNKLTLVTLGADFCGTAACEESALAAIEAAPGLIALGIPQSWLNEDRARARAFVARKAEQGIGCFVADFGSDGADLLLLSRVEGMMGVCMDGSFLRELSVEPEHTQALVSAVMHCAQRLSLRVLVRQLDRDVCPIRA
jgi:diguanylate cyclase (GGDEF)-like protein